MQWVQSSSWTDYVQVDECVCNISLFDYFDQTIQFQWIFCPQTSTSSRTNFKPWGSQSLGVTKMNPLAIASCHFNGMWCNRTSGCVKLIHIIFLVLYSDLIYKCAVPLMSLSLSDRSMMEWWHQIRTFYHWNAALATTWLYLAHPACIAFLTRSLSYQQDLLSSPVKKKKKNLLCGTIQLACRVSQAF